MRVQDGPKHCGDLSTEWDKLMGKFGYTRTSKQGQGTFPGSKSSQDGLATDVMLNPDSLMGWLTLSCTQEQVQDSAHFQTTAGTCLGPCWPTPLTTSLADSLTGVVFNSPALPLCNLLVKIPLSGHFSSEEWVCRLLLFRAWSQHLPHLSQHVPTQWHSKYKDSKVHPAPRGDSSWWDSSVWARWHILNCQISRKSASPGLERAGLVICPAI